MIDQRLGGASEWKIHDIRRTVVTGLAKLGVQPHVIAAVLNHAPRGITAQVYNRYSYVKEKRETLDLWAKHVLAIVEHYKPALTPEEIEADEAEEERRAIVAENIDRFRGLTLEEAKAQAVLSNT